jgi:hypothetical protein
MTDDGMATLKKFTAKLKPDETFFLKPLTRADVDNEARSNELNKYYWKVIVPALQYYAPWLDFCNGPDDGQNAHYMIKMTYCLTAREDLLTKVKIRNPENKKIVTRYVPFSWKFSETTKKEANAFMDWCKNQIVIHSTVDFDTAIRGATC